MNYDDDSHESRDAVLVEPHGHDVGVGLVQREHHVDRRLAVVLLRRDGGEQPGGRYLYDVRTEGVYTHFDDHGTISKFWDITVCLFSECLSVCTWWDAINKAVKLSYV